MLGIAAGIAVAAVVGQSILWILESVFLHFVRGNDYAAWTIGAVVTALFSLLLNGISFSKVKKLKLTDIAKQ